MKIQNYKVLDGSYISQSGQEMYNLKKLIEKTFDIPGDVAEVGVYKGGSASLIFSEMNQDKNLYLFDTFDTFIGAGEFDPPWINQTLVGPQIDRYPYIVEHFNRFPNVYVIKGDFPAVIRHFLDINTFSFVHLDVDIYLPTLKSLEFFYPKMNTGGIFIIHDYIHQELRGVRKAVEEFFKDKPEKINFVPESGFQMSHAWVIKE